MWKRKEGEEEEGGFHHPAESDEGGKGGKEGRKEGRKEAVVLVSAEDSERSLKRETKKREEGRKEGKRTFGLPPSLCRFPSFPWVEWGKQGGEKPYVYVGSTGGRKKAMDCALPPPLTVTSVEEEKRGRGEGTMW